MRDVRARCQYLTLLKISFRSLDISLSVNVDKANRMYTQSCKFISGTKTICKEFFLMDKLTQLKIMM